MSYRVACRVAFTDNNSLEYTTQIAHLLYMIRVCEYMFAFGYP